MVGSCDVKQINPRYIAAEIFPPLMLYNSQQISLFLVLLEGGPVIPHFLQLVMMAFMALMVQLMF